MKLSVKEKVVGNSLVMSSWPTKPKATWRWLRLTVKNYSTMGCRVSKSTSLVLILINLNTTRVYSKEKGESFDQELLGFAHNIMRTQRTME